MNIKKDNQTATEEKLRNTMYERVKDIAKKLESNTAKVGAIKKSTWKRLVKDKMKNKIEERLKREMEVRQNQEYILNCDGENARDINADKTTLTKK